MNWEAKHCSHSTHQKASEQGESFKAFQFFLNVGSMVATKLWLSVILSSEVTWKQQSSKHVTGSQTKDHSWGHSCSVPSSSTGSRKTRSSGVSSASRLVPALLLHSLFHITCCWFELLPLLKGKPQFPPLCREIQNHAEKQHSDSTSESGPPLCSLTLVAALRSGRIEIGPNRLYQWWLQMGMFVTQGQKEWQMLEGPFERRHGDNKTHPVLLLLGYINCVPACVDVACLSQWDLFWGHLVRCI